MGSLSSLLPLWLLSTWGLMPMPVCCTAVWATAVWATPALAMVATATATSATPEPPTLPPPTVMPVPDTVLAIQVCLRSQVRIPVVNTFSSINPSPFHRTSAIKIHQALPSWDDMKFSILFVMSDYH